MGEELRHTVIEQVKTPIQFSYGRRNVLLYALTVPQCKITRHKAHMKIKWECFYIHNAVNCHISLILVLGHIILPCDRVPPQ